jgi:hypothetical protein
MKIRLPFVYTAQVKIGRKTNAQPVDFLEHVEVDIPELTAAQAPVAVSWYGDPRNEYQEARTFEGGFYVTADKAKRGPGTFPASALADPERLGEEIAGSIAHMLAYPITSKGEERYLNLLAYLKGDKKPPEEKDVKEWTSSTRESATARAQDVAYGLVSIDGELWRRVSEPVLAVNVEDDQVSLSVQVDGTRHGDFIDPSLGTKVGGHSKTRFFPLDRFDDAISVAAQMVRAAKPVRYAVSEAPVVHIPELMVFDEAFDSALRTAEHVVAVLKPTIGRYSRPVVEAWVLIRDTVECHRMTGDRSIVDALGGGMLPGFAEMMVEIPGLSLGQEIFDGLEAWDNGKIDVDSFRL